MPRKKRPNILNLDEKKDVLNDVYIDAYSVKNVSVNAMKSIAINIDYTNKEDVLSMLPLVQKQMEIIQNANDTILDVEERIN